MPRLQLVNDNSISAVAIFACQIHYNCPRPFSFESGALVNKQSSIKIPPVIQIPHKVRIDYSFNHPCWQKFVVYIYKSAKLYDNS